MFESKIQREKMHMSTYLKIALNYYQILAIISNLNINWPYEVKQYINSFSFLGDFAGQLFSSDCFFNEIGILYSSIYIRTIKTIAIPIFICSYIFVYFFLKMVIWRNEKARKIIVAIIVVHVVFQPTIVTVLLESLNYLDIENKKYLFSETNVEWDSFEFQAWVLLIR